MSNKRDQLKKLKQNRTTQSIREMSSPVEDKLNELETYENHEEIKKEVEEVSVEQPITEVEIEVKAETESKVETVPEPLQTAEPEIRPEVRLDVSPAVSEEKEPEKAKETTKRTSMALLVENNKFIRLRSMQLGMSIQDYVNLLIDEVVEREKSGQAEDMGDIAENLDMNYRRGQNSTIVALVLKESNAKFLKRGGAMHGMNATTFLNHIISEEQQREKTNGPRKGVFDD